MYFSSSMHVIFTIFHNIRRMFNRGWKGSDSLILMRWLLKLLRGGPVRFEEGRRPGISLLVNAGDRGGVYNAVHDGCCSVLLLFQLLHKGSLWLERPQAGKIIECVELFCAVYGFLANFFMRERKCRFHMEPSLHLFYHIALRLRETLDSGAPVLLNPALFMCEQSEDWVGRISRITRRVHARTCGQRTLQRYLVKMFLELEKHGI